MLISPSFRSWIEEADSLARRIQQDAIRDSGNGLVWLHPTSRKPIGPYLYHGNTGIALFLAGLEHASSSPRHYHTLSLAAIAPLRRDLARLIKDPDLAVKTRFRLGGMVGLGGYIYAFTQIGIWLAEPALVEEARDLTLLLSPDRIASDNDLDVSHGSAGVLLALLLLHRHAAGPNTHGETPLDLARACGRHLVKRRSSDASSPRGWRPANGGLALGGFAHGATGIAYALLSLYRRTGEEEFRSAALEGFRYEATHYNPSRKNWRDLRNPDRDTYMMGWCSGAPGIALARAGALDVADTEETRLDLDNALTSVLSAQLSRRDHLCCGNMSRVEALIESANALRNEGLKTRACHLALEVLDRARRADGQFGLFDGQDQSCFDPSLLCGAAGVGFTFLRLEDSPQMPCLLLMK